MERATLEEGRQDGMARVRAAAAHTTGNPGCGGGAAVLVVERAALGAALLSLGDEEEVEGQEVAAAAAEVAEAEASLAEKAEEAEAAEAALSSATEINAICVVYDKVAPLNTTPRPRALRRCWPAHLNPNPDTNPNHGPAALLVLLPAGVRVDLKWLALVRCTSSRVVSALVRARVSPLG